MGRGSGGRDHSWHEYLNQQRANFHTESQDCEQWQGAKGISRLSSGTRWYASEILVAAPGNYIMPSQQILRSKKWSVTWYCGSFNYEKRLFFKDEEAAVMFALALNEGNNTDD